MVPGPSNCPGSLFVEEDRKQGSREGKPRFSLTCLNPKLNLFLPEVIGLPLLEFFPCEIMAETALVPCGVVRSQGSGARG